VSELFPGFAVFGLDLRLRLPTPLPRGVFLGNALRGLLGHGLHCRVCIRPGTACGECLLAANCAYPATFKPLSDSELPGYVLHRWRADPTSPRHLVVSLHLIGRHGGAAEDWLRGLHTTLPELSWFNAQGLALDEARCASSHRKIFSSGKLQPGAQLLPLAPTPVPAGAVTLRAHTPLVSKHHGADPFYPALRTRLQRLLNDFSESAVLPKEAPWRVVSETWRTVSHRLNAERTLSGLTGHQVLDGISPEGRLLLALGQQIHAGGQVTLGCGRYTFEALSAARPTLRPPKSSPP
jgi:hypothetical protein